MCSQALGLTPRQTGAVVLVEGLLLTATAGIAGVGLGVVMTWFFMADGLDLAQIAGELSEMQFSGVAIDPVIYPQFRLSRLAQSAGWIILIGGIASIYPAVRAATIDVAESMKFER